MIIKGGAMDIHIHVFAQTKVCFSRLNVQQGECSIRWWIYFHFPKRKTAVSIDSTS